MYEWSPSGVRRKCFISYYREDHGEVEKFVKSFRDIFIPKAIGISSADDLIDSADPDYVMRRIRTEYLGDSTITICLIGNCTHSRRYVDWELKASLRQGDTYNPNGLLGIVLPSQGDAAHLPPRFKANWKDDRTGYALYRRYPNSGFELREWIEEAYTHRTTRARLIENSQSMMRYNGKCVLHGVTH